MESEQYMDTKIHYKTEGGCHYEKADCIMLCLVLAVVVYQNYPYDILESIETGKQAILIEKPSETTNEEFLSNIEYIVSELDTDLAYQYVDVNGTDLTYLYYMTNHSENFVDTNAALALSNVEFYSLEQAAQYDISMGIYYISEAKCNEVVAGLQNYGYDVTITQQANVSGKTPIFGKKIKKYGKEK